jgi:hypothetical protein
MTAIATARPDPALDYFAWGLEASAPVRPVAEYLRSERDVDVAGAANWLGGIVRAELHPPRNLWEGPTREDVLPLLELSPPQTASPSDYMASVGRHPMGLDVRAELDADQRGVLYGRLEEAGYRLMLLAFIGAADGDEDAIRWLGVLMARGNLNRRLTIVHFLGAHTGGDIGREGTPESYELPATTDEILKWAVKAVRQPVTHRTSPALVGAYAERFRHG